MSGNGRTSGRLIVPPTGSRPRRSGQSERRLLTAGRAAMLRSALGAACIAEIVVFSIVARGFFSTANALNIALSVAITGILAVGMTAIILTGGIDLSVGSVVALSGIVAARASLLGGGTALVLLGILAGCLVGGAFGVTTGFLVARLRVPSFVATLAFLTIARGLAFVASGGRSIGDLPDSFGALGRSSIVGIPAPVVSMLVLMAVGRFVLARTILGRHVYAVGGNPEAAWLAGIDVRRVTWLVYAISGLLTGFAGVTLASRLGAGVPNAGLQYELDVIAAVVVGGTSLTGGRGGIAGTLLGTVFIGILGNGLNLANVPSEVQKIAIGVVILLAVLADRAARGEDSGRM